MIEKEREEIEKCFIRERDLKDKYLDKCNLLEKRCLEGQAELVMHRLKSQRFDNEKKELERRMREADYKMQD